MIAECAYFRAERRGFDTGDPVSDWLEAEREIDAMLSSAGRGDPGARDPERQAVQSKVELMRHEAEAALAGLRDEGHRLTAKARAELGRLLDSLAPLQERAARELGELQKSADGPWRALATGAEQAWAELAQAVEAARSRLRERGSALTRKGGTGTRKPTNVQRRPDH
jgi:hypothetical protein